MSQYNIKVRLLSYESIDINTTKQELLIGVSLASFALNLYS